MYVKAIEGQWQDQGFVPVSDLHYQDSSERRMTFEAYAAGVDWTDVAQVERALRVFESQLRWLARQEWHRPSSFDEVRELLDDDGFELDERCRIRWRRPPALEATLGRLTDPSGIRAELERIRRALPDDPAGAIGAAKQLVEATAKVVLTERHLPVAADAKVPELVKGARRRCTCIRPRQSPDQTARRRSRRSSAACHQSQSVWLSSAIAAMAPGTARPARRPDSARGMRIWLSTLRSPGASCCLTHSLIPRRRGGASGLTCQVRSSNRALRVPLVELVSPSLPSMRRWFVMPCDTSHRYTTAQVRTAVGVLYREAE
jgi:hypothetical protein